MRKQILGLGLAMLATIALAAGANNKWRLQCSGGADSDGRIVLEFTPVDGQPMRATVHIHEGRSENGVAHDINTALRAQVGARYNVEVDDGEDVLVKKKRGEHDFMLTIVENTVQGVRLNPDEE